MPKAPYDKQGMYFHSLVKQAGWSQTKVNNLLVKRFAATHWNALSVDQRRAAINMMRSYANKNRDNVGKKIRQSIMAMVARHGHTVEWLHEMMVTWGYGDSLRKLSMPELIECGKAVTKALEPQKISNTEKSRGEQRKAEGYNKEEKSKRGKEINTKGAEG